MPRKEASKSHALRPRDGIQSRLEQQKEKARNVEPKDLTESVSVRAEMVPEQLDSDTVTDDAVTVATAAEPAANTSIIATDSTQSTPAKSSDKNLQSNPTQERRGRGRPANSTSRTVLTLRPNSDTARALRVYAAKNGYGMSDILDVLVELYLDDNRVAEELAATKVRRKI